MPWNIVIFILLVLVAYGYLDFAYLDHRQPHKSGNKWAMSVTSMIMASFCLSSFVQVKENPEVAATLAMVVLGMLTAPAITPPPYLSPQDSPDGLERFIATIQTRFGGAVFRQVIAWIIAVVSLILPGGWYLITGGVCLLLLFSKGAALAMKESGGMDAVISPRAMRHWGKRILLAAVCFGVVWNVGPYMVLSQTDFTPLSWSAFAGFGIGALLTELH